jgi:hypothetical protein
MNLSQFMMCLSLLDTLGVAVEVALIEKKIKACNLNAFLKLPVFHISAAPSFVLVKRT